MDRLVNQRYVENIPPYQPAMAGIYPFFLAKRSKMAKKAPFNMTTVKNTGQGSQAGCAGLFHIVVYRHIRSRCFFHAVEILHIKGKIFSPMEEWIKAQATLLNDGGKVKLIPKGTVIKGARLLH